MTAMSHPTWESLPHLPQEVIAAVIEALYASDTPTDEELAALLQRFPDNAAGLRAHWVHAMRLREETTASSDAAEAPITPRAEVVGSGSQFDRRCAAQLQ